MTLPIERLARWVLTPKCRNCGGLRERGTDFCSQTCFDEHQERVAW